MARSKLPQQVNNGFGPISEKRGSRSTLVACLLAVLFSALGLVLLKYFQQKEGKQWSFEVLTVAVSISGVIIGEAVRRCCLFCEELKHVETRYDGKKMKAFKACLMPTNWSFALSIMTIGFCIAGFLQKINPGVLSLTHVEIFFINVTLAPLFSYITGLHLPSSVEISKINEDESKNLADGLAWSYYFGYLKLILPQLETTINNTLLQVDGAAVRDHIPVKVFIIIPKNCYCYDKFDDVDPRIKFVDSTASLEINRAGVQRRVYKNSIYRVTSQDNETFYCLMEYATPLLSLYDMGQHANARLSSSERDQQVILFYKKLTEVLEGDSECRGKYHIILTSDPHNKLADTVAQEIKATNVLIPAHSNQLET